MSTNFYLKISMDDKKAANLILNKNKYYDELINQFQTYVLDLREHIIWFGHEIDLHYIIDSSAGYKKSSVQVSIVFYFDIYPVKIYYAEGGLGYYRLKLSTLCESNNYSEKDLKKWYNEIYPKRSAEGKTNKELCSAVTKWVNTLNTKKLDKL